MGGEDRVLKVGPYTALVYGSELSSGGWTAWAVFERRSTDSPDEIPLQSRRHQIPQPKGSLSEALAACEAMANQLFADGRI